MSTAREIRVRVPASSANLGAGFDAFALALGLHLHCALRPSGGITDLYRREAMLRLGRFREGSVRTEAGETLRTGSSLEMALALQSAATVEGYLALLGALARSEPQPEQTMRSLVAPQLSNSEFAPIYEVVEGARRSCHR